MKIDIIRKNNFEITANHFCGIRYSVTEKDNVDRLLAAIPDNLMELDREGMKPVVKAVMHEMNVLWSSVGLIPNFPEKFGEKTKLAICPDRVFMSGEGWNVTIYNGDAKDIMKKTSDAIKNTIADEKLTEEQKIENIGKITGPLAELIGD